MLFWLSSAVLANDVEFYEDWFAKYKKNGADSLTELVIEELKRKSTLYQKRTGFPEEFVSSKFWTEVSEELGPQIRSLKSVNTRSVVPQFFKKYTTYEYLENKLNQHVGLSGFSKELLEEQSGYFLPSFSSQATHSSSTNSIQVDLNASKII